MGRWPVGPGGRYALPGDNLYTNSTDATDADSRAIKFHFPGAQSTPYDYEGVNETALTGIDRQKV